MSRTAAAALFAALGSMLVAGSVEMARVPQLVAFVPKHNTQAMTPARQVELAALLARENADAKVTLPANYRAIPARAVLPEAHPVANARKRISSGTDTRANHVASSSAQQIAKADRSGDRVISASPQSQQWVVVAAWEQVSTFSRAPQTVSDHEPDTAAAQNPATNTTGINTDRTSPTGVPAPSSGNQNHTPAPANQYTVTQLILHVVPANQNSSSTQPATAPVRDGWFVIQL